MSKHVQGTLQEVCTSDDVSLVAQQYFMEVSGNSIHSLEGMAVASTPSVRNQWFVLLLCMIRSPHTMSRSIAGAVNGYFRPWPYLLNLILISPFPLTE